MDSESRSESALNSPTEPDISMAASLTDQPPEAQTLEEARKIIRDLRMRYRAQAHQLLIWRRAHKIQEDISSRVQREKAEQLKSLSSQLLLFESRLIRKQKEITALLAQRETIIMRQQRIIESLTNKLLDNGLEPAHPIVDYRDLINETNLVADFDSLNDSDSAVIMEDLDSDYNNLSHMLPRFRSVSTDSVTIVRSISDAIDPNLKYTSVRRSNGFLRRPEILETVYSVEEEPDGDGLSNKLSAQNSTEKDIFKDGNADKEDANALMTQAQNRRDIFKMRSEKVSGEAGKLTTEVAKLDTKNLDANALTDVMCQQIAWAYSYVPKRQISNLAYSDDNLSDSHILDGSLLLGECPLEKNKGNQVTTYNRVMSNHRSVTKPKDVKYKRINKAKSKSLEELRGRLRNWVEKGNKLTGISLDQAQSYA